MTNDKFPSEKYQFLVILGILSVSFLCTCNSTNGREFKVDSKILIPLTEQGSVDDFYWSPNGKTLAYVIDLVANYACKEDIILVDLGKKGVNANKRKLNEEGPLTCGSDFSWSSDSKSVIFSDRGGVRKVSYVFDLETGKKKAILKPENWVIFDEEYSPVANKIVCTAVYADTSKWYKMNEIDKIINLELFRPWQIALIDLGENSFELLAEDTTEREQFGASWFPDGKSILYILFNQEPKGNAYSYYRVDLSTDKKEKIYEGDIGYDILGFSQDGRELILEKFEEVGPHYCGAWTLKTDGSGEMRRLTDSLPGEAPSSYYREVFSPDLRFVADLYVKESKPYLRIRELSTSKQILLDAFLQQSRREFPIAWSPDGKSICYLAKDSSSSYPVIMMATIIEE